MHIEILWQESGKFPQFNVALCKVAGAEPFLTVKGCRIVQGSKGEFVSWPATKNEKTGKYWNHVYAGEAFATHILTLAKAALPGTARGVSRKAADDADEIPF